MGRKSRARSLSVWANGLRVGTWTLPARGDPLFVYDDAWIASPLGRPLSLSLPFTGAPLQGERVLNYFDNLLPDSEPIRKRLASRFKTGSTGAFELLQALGRDCVGAVQLLGEDEAPHGIERIEATPMAEGDVERLIVSTTASRGPIGGPEDEEQELRISLAGAQEKTALLWHDGRWHLPHGSTPTSHILKLPMGLVGHRKADFSTSVENEWLCMHLLAEFGLSVPATELVRFGAQKALSVTRFDRALHGSGRWLLRLPQEDFCQANGLPSHLKYEGDGGPGLVELTKILRGSVDATHDLSTLLKVTVLFWLLAAPDGHAKNFSIRLLPRGRYAMTPLYDVMSLWPVEGRGPNQYSRFKAKMAMALLGTSKHYGMREIQRRHFNSTAARCFQRVDAEDVIEQVLARTPAAIDAVARKIPAGFPEQVAHTIFSGLRQGAERLAGMPKG